MRTKTPQIILHNYIKIIGRNIQISRTQQSAQQTEKKRYQYHPAATQI